MFASVELNWVILIKSLLSLADALDVTTLGDAAGNSVTDAAVVVPAPGPPALGDPCTAAENG